MLELSLLAIGIILVIAYELNKVNASLDHLCHSCDRYMEIIEQEYGSKDKSVK